VLLVQLSDPHIVGRRETLLGGIDTTAFLRDAVTHVNRMRPAPDLVLVTGDLVNEGTPPQYDHLAELLAPLAAPLHLMPGNHDRTAHLKQAFPDCVHDRDGRADGVIEGSLRIVTLDSSRFPEPGGALDAEQLTWLDEVLGSAPAAPTVVTLHHPPFVTGIAHMDAMGLALESTAALAEVIGRHPQVERLLSGHLHRFIVRRFAGTVAMTCPSTAHAIHLVLDDAPPAWSYEPPALLLHRWHPDDGLVTHLQVIGDHRPVAFGD
jgi:3',5'-cyclic AMP phosphodiesterase CpdA